MEGLTLAWTGAVAFLAATAAIAFLGGQATRRQRTRTTLFSGATLLAAGSYAAAAAGADPVLARLAGWTLTTPLILVALAVTAAPLRTVRARSGGAAVARRSEGVEEMVAALVVLDLMMIGCGALASAIGGAAGWVWLAAGAAPFGGILLILWWPLREASEEGHPLRAETYFRHAAVLTVLWAPYPAVLALSPALAGWTDAWTTAALFLVLDLSAKGAFGLYVVLDDSRLAEIETQDRPFPPVDRGAARRPRAPFAALAGAGAARPVRREQAGGPGARPPGASSSAASKRRTLEGRTSRAERPSPADTPAEQASAVEDAGVDARSGSMPGQRSGERAAPAWRLRLQRTLAGRPRAAARSLSDRFAGSLRRIDVSAVLRVVDRKGRRPADGGGEERRDRPFRLPRVSLPRIPAGDGRSRSAAAAASETGLAGHSRSDILGARRPARRGTVRMRLSRSPASDRSQGGSQPPGGSAETRGMRLWGGQSLPFSPRKAAEADGAQTAPSPVRPAGRKRARARLVRRTARPREATSADHPAGAVPAMAPAGRRMGETGGRTTGGAAGPPRARRPAVMEAVARTFPRSGADPHGPAKPPRLRTGATGPWWSILRLADGKRFGWWSRRVGNVPANALVDRSRAMLRAAREAEFRALAARLALLRKDGGRSKEEKTLAERRAIAAAVIADLRRRLATGLPGPVIERTATTSGIRRPPRRVLLRQRPRMSGRSGGPTRLSEEAVEPQRTAPPSPANSSTGPDRTGIATETPPPRLPTAAMDRPGAGGDDTREQAAGQTRAGTRPAVPTPGAPRRAPGKDRAIPVGVALAILAVVSRPRRR